MASSSKESGPLKTDLCAWGSCDGILRYVYPPTGPQNEKSLLLRQEEATLVRQNRFDDALTFYSKAAKEFPDVAEFHANVGLLQLHRGDLDEAISCLGRSVLLDPHLA